VKHSEMMPGTVNPATMWTLIADKRSIRLTLPPFTARGSPQAAVHPWILRRPRSMKSSTDCCRRWPAPGP